jgi:hypothetical protein
VIFKDALAMLGGAVIVTASAPVAVDVIAVTPVCFISSAEVESPPDRKEHTAKYDHRLEALDAHTYHASHPTS